MQETHPLAIGVDLGATKIAAALVRNDGKVLATRQVLTAAEEGSPAVLDRIAGLVGELLFAASASVLGIGVGSPGVVNPSEGVVRNAVNLGWEEVHLADELLVRLPQGPAVWIGKDANASALGEHYFGAAQRVTDFVYLGIGSGLGGGVMAQGNLVTGAHQNAAELGHLSLDPEGWLCSCGQRGCAETLVSGPGLVRLVNSYRSNGRFTTILPDQSDLSTAEILSAARSGDELALAAIAIVGRRLGMVMAACVGVLDPAMFVIGGGLGLVAFDFLVPEARAELMLRTLPASHQFMQIIPSQQTSPAVGAACLVWYSQKSQNYTVIPDRKRR